jgi:hypothetical protein
MTIRETALVKLQRLPDSLLQQVSDFIDFLSYRKLQDDSAVDCGSEELSEKWTQWFEGVDHLPAIPTQSADDYQQHLLLKYRKQGLEL